MQRHSGFKVAGALALACLVLTFVQEMYGSKTPCAGGSCEPPLEAKSPDLAKAQMPVVWDR